MKDIKKFLDNPYEFIETNNVKKLISLAKKADDAYYNSDKPLLSDRQYDMLRDTIRARDPDNPYLQTSGATVKVDKIKIKLPYRLGSAYKPLSREIIKFIAKFKHKFPGPYIISEKLDGVSALYRSIASGNKLMTKGDSEKGTDISNLVNHLVPDKHENGVDVRGEIIMKNSTFLANHASTKMNARNAISGLVNSKTVDHHLLNDSDFVAYELIRPWVPFDQQFTMMNNMGFTVARYELVNDINLSMLQEYYSRFVNESEYECDGIIVCQNAPQNRSTEKYPEYMFAFKNLDDLESAIVTVKSVIWQISKDGYMKPVITFDPISLSGVEVKRVTSHNAKYIYDNNLGPNAKIEVVRSGGVIPYIKKIVKGASRPQMPNVSYEWNLTQVDIITTEYSDEQKTRELAKFFSVLEIDGMGEANTKKFIDANIDTIPKIFRITKKQLSTVENFKAKMVDKTYDAITDAIATVKLPELMVASNIFGHGFGIRLIKRIFNTYPNIVFQFIEHNDDDFFALLLGVDDFGEERSKQFQLAMPMFLDMLSELPNRVQDRLLFEPYEEDVDNEDSKFSGKTFVFSGTRRPEWERIIVSKGGIIGSSVSKNTYAVITTKDEINKQSNSKVKNAIKLGCRLLSHEEFNREFII